MLGIKVVGQNSALLCLILYLEMGKLVPNELSLQVQSICCPMKILYMRWYSLSGSSFLYCICFHTDTGSDFGIPLASAAPNYEIYNFYTHKGIALS